MERPNARLRTLASEWTQPEPNLTDHQLVAKGAIGAISRLEQSGVPPILRSNYRNLNQRDLNAGVYSDTDTLNLPASPDMVTA